MNKTTLIIFVLTLAVLAGGGAAVHLSLTNALGRIDKLTALHEVELVREDLVIRIDQVQAYISRNKIRGSGDVDALNARIREMDLAVASCLGCHHSPERTQGLLALHDVAVDYEQAISSLVASAANPAKAPALERKAQDAGRDLIAMSKGMAFAANTGLHKQTRTAARFLRTIRILAAAVFALSLALAVAGALLLLQASGRKRRRMLDALRRVKRGDFSSLPEGAAGQGTADLEEAFNDMAKSLSVSQGRREQDARIAGAAGLAASLGRELTAPLDGMARDADALLSLAGLPEQATTLLHGLKRQLTLCREGIGRLSAAVPQKPVPQVKADVMALVKDTVLQTQPEARNGKVAVVLDCAADLPALAVDGERMKNVFLNLNRTLMRMMSDGGSMTIRCSQGRDAGDGDAVFVDYITSGPGVTEEAVQNLFIPVFSFSPNGEKSRGGLAAGYGTVRGHGGYLDVRPLPGEGILVRVVLPLSGGPERTA